MIKMDCCDANTGPNIEPQSKERLVIVSGAKCDSPSYKSKHVVSTAVEAVIKRDELAKVRAFLLTKDEMMLQQIGSGAFAEVYRGVNQRHHKLIAIKVINLDRASAHYRQQLLPQEASVLRQLKHERIIKLYRLAQVGQVVVMVMEYAAKGTLSDLVCEVGRLSEPVTCTIFGAFFSALAYMHHHRIAHRDLKLDNVLINHRNIPKLADFSFAVHFDGVLCTNYCGSIPYFAPELLANQPYNPLVSDIWSIAVCLFIMTNDTFPFRFTDHKAMLEAQCNRSWHFRSRTEKEFSTSFKDLLSLMLEPDVNRRIRTETITRHPWMITSLNEMQTVPDITNPTTNGNLNR